MTSVCMVAVYWYAIHMVMLLAWWPGMYVCVCMYVIYVCMSCMYICIYVMYVCNVCMYVCMFIVQNNKRYRVHVLK